MAHRFPHVSHLSTVKQSSTSPSPRSKLKVPPHIRNNPPQSRSRTLQSLLLLLIKVHRQGPRGAATAQDDGEADAAAEVGDPMADGADEVLVEEDGGADAGDHGADAEGRGAFAFDDGGGRVAALFGDEVAVEGSGGDGFVDGDAADGGYGPGDLCLCVRYGKRDEGGDVLGGALEVLNNLRIGCRRAHREHRRRWSWRRSRIFSRLASQPLLTFKRKIKNNK